MSFLTRWSEQPSDYRWVVGYMKATSGLVVNKSVTGIACLFSAGGALAATTTDFGPHERPYVYVVYAVAAMTTLIGVAFILGPFPSENASAAFVLFADFSVALCMVLFASPQAAIPGTALFAITGSWATAFHGVRLLLAHLVWSLGTLVALYCAALLQPNTDVGLTTGRFLLLVPVLAAGPILMHSLLLSLRQDAERSFYDPLTGLRNRRGLDAAVAGLFESALRTSYLGVLIIDIDRFKRLNDTHGHAAGDVALQLAASRLNEVVGLRGVTARIGGEEFVAMLRADRASLGALAQRLCETLNNRHDACPVTVSIGVSDGTASRHDLSNTVSALLARADTAMYTAKKRGGNQYARE